MASALKLSPALKALIKLPAARGSPVPAPAAPVLKSLFDKVRKTGEAGGVGRDTWLTMNTGALFAINSPDALCQLFDYATTEDDTKGKVQAAAVMRESGLKSISFVGVSLRTTSRWCECRREGATWSSSWISTKSYQVVH